MVEQRQLDNFLFSRGRRGWKKVSGNFHGLQLSREYKALCFVYIVVVHETQQTKAEPWASIHGGLPCLPELNLNVHKKQYLYLYPPCDLLNYKKNKNWDRK